MDEKIRQNNLAKEELMEQVENQMLDNKILTAALFKGTEAIANKIKELYYLLIATEIIQKPDTSGPTVKFIRFITSGSKKGVWNLLIDEDMPNQCVARDRKGYRIVNKTFIQDRIEVPYEIKAMYFSDDKETSVLAEGIIDGMLDLSK